MTRRFVIRETIPFKDLEKIYYKNKGEDQRCHKMLFRDTTVYDIPMTTDQFRGWLVHRFYDCQFKNCKFINNLGPMNLA